MAFQSAFIGEFLFTKVTLERLFSRVNFEMFFQTAFPSEFIFTKVALKRFFSSVNFDMVIQIFFSRKSLVTTVTLENFFLCSFIAFQLVFTLNHRISCSFFIKLFLVVFCLRLHRIFVPRKNQSIESPNLSDARNLFHPKRNGVSPFGFVISHIQCYEPFQYTTNASFSTIFGANLQRLKKLGIFYTLCTKVLYAGNEK